MYGRLSDFQHLKYLLSGSLQNIYWLLLINVSTWIDYKNNVKWKLQVVEWCVPFIPFILGCKTGRTVL